MALTEIAKRNEIQPGIIVPFTLENTSIILLEHGGEVKAYQGNCPHQGTPLSNGHIENGEIICPLHKWHFACQNGKNSSNNSSLTSYPLVEKEEKLYIDTSVLKATTYDQKVKGNITIKELPMPKGNPILGHLLQFNTRSKHQVVEEWANESGTLLKVNFLGKKVVVSTDPDFNLQVFKDRPHTFRRFSKINEVFEEIGLFGVFNAEGDRWSNQRKVVAEALNLKNVIGFFPIIREKTLTLLKRWNRLREKQSVDVQQELMRYTVDITTCIAFGHDTNTMEKEDDVIQNHLEKIFPMINKRITAPFPLWRFIKSSEDKKFELALGEIRKTIDNLIKAAKEKLALHPELKASPTNFLEAMLVQQEMLGKFTDYELFGNVFTMLLAGEDTTSNSISWALYYLALHSEVVNSIREESETVYGKEPVATSYEQINQLKWAEAAALEGMRLKPVTPMVFMETLKDTVVGTLSLKKGSMLILHNKAPQTKENYFSQAESYLPQRWLKDSKCPVHGAHTPDVIHVFGAGPRYCPGKNLAMIEMVIAISMICKNFDLKLNVAPETVQEIFAFTMFPENLLISLIPVQVGEYA